MCWSCPQALWEELPLVASAPWHHQSGGLRHWGKLWCHEGITCTALLAANLRRVQNKLQVPVPSQTSCKITMLSWQSQQGFQWAEGLSCLNTPIHSTIFNWPPSHLHYTSWQCFTLIFDNDMAVIKDRAGLSSTVPQPPNVISSIAKHLSQQCIKDAHRWNRTKLNTEGHWALHDKMNNSGSLAPKHADTTKENIHHIIRKFVR